MIYALLALAAGAFLLSKTDQGQALVSSAESDVTDFGTAVSEKIQEVSPGWSTYDALFQQYAADSGIDWQWLKAFALNESSLGAAPSVARGLASPSDVEGSKSSDGKSWGLMQMTLTTGRDIDPSVTPEKLNDPEYSIAMAAHYIAKLETYFSSLDERFQEWVVKSYNQGPGNTLKESHGTGGGYADEYWARWQRNYQRVVNS